MPIPDPDPDLRLIHILSMPFIGIRIQLVTDKDFSTAIQTISNKKKTSSVDRVADANSGSGSRFETDPYPGLDLGRTC